MVCRCADFVLLNKVDTLKEGQLESLMEIAKSLNPLAKVRFQGPLTFLMKAVICKGNIVHSVPSGAL